MGTNEDEGSFKGVVGDEVVRVYLAANQESVESARTHAQVGFTIASAVAGAIVAAGIFSDIREADAKIQALVVASVVAWLAASYLFLRAVAVHPKFARAERKTERQEFVDAALEGIRVERQRVVKFLWWAQRATLVAMVLSVVAGAAVLTQGTQLPRFWIQSDEELHGRLQLTPAAIKQLNDACPFEVETIEGSLDPAELKDEFVAVTIDTGVCASDERIARVRSRGIVAFFETPRPDATTVTTG